MICIGGTTAWEVYRASGRLLPQALDRPRTSRVGTCQLPGPQILADDMRRFGARSMPFHIMVEGRAQGSRRADVRLHACAVPLSRRALIRLKSPYAIVSPELLFIQLAAMSGFDEVDVALAGCEMCGTYVLDEDEHAWDGLVNTDAPMTSVEKIGRMIDASQGRHGITRARRALELVRDRSNSPMETVLLALFCFPRRLGGLGLGPVKMNRHVVTATGDRWVDLLFVNHMVGMEYKGVRAHSIERTARDDRRQNKLVGSGIKIINVWYEDLVDGHLFGQLVQDVAHAMKVRLRIRSEDFAGRQRVLRHRLMTTITRFGEFRSRS